MSRIAAVRRVIPRRKHLWFAAGLAVVAALATGVPVAAAASTSVSRASLAAQHTGRMTQGTRAADGPRTWHVLVGGQSKDRAIQAEGYYPHVITIDAGDTVAWTLNTGEIHCVTFAGTCADLSCIPPCAFTVNVDVSPCGPPSYDGVSALDSSGRMVPPAYNWDNSIPHGDTTYSLTFTKPGVNVYFDLSVAGMRGMVIVHPAGTPYPFTQAQYSEQAQEQLRADLAAGARAQERLPAGDGIGQSRWNPRLSCRPRRESPGKCTRRSRPGSRLRRARTRVPRGIRHRVLAGPNHCGHDRALRADARQRSCCSDPPWRLRSASSDGRHNLQPDIRPPGVHAEQCHRRTGRESH